MINHPILAPYRSIIDRAAMKGGGSSPTAEQWFIDNSLIPAAQHRLRIQPGVSPRNFPLETITVEGSEIRMMREISCAKNADEERAAVKRHTDFLRASLARGVEFRNLHTHESWDVL